MNKEAEPVATDAMVAHDSLKSFLGGLGNKERDKAAALTFVDKQIDDYQLMAAFQNNWIAKKIVLLVPFDSTRKWRNWEGEQGSKVVAEEKRLNYRAKVFEASWKGRLFGGAAGIIGIDGDDMETELDPAAVKQGSFKYFTVLSRRDLHAEELETNVESKYHNQPKFYTVSNGLDSPSLQKSVRIHPSRLVIFKGDDKPDIMVADGQSLGWGNSTLKVVHDAILHYGGVFQGIASLVLAANVDVIAVPDLLEKMGNKKKKESLLKRFSFAAAAVGITGMLIRDTKEEYERNSANFSNLDSIMEKFAIQCAAADGIPATVFLSQSPSGLQSTGDSDFQIHHDRVGSHQAVVMEPAMHIADQCLIMSTFGNIPEDIKFTWNPLKQMSEKDRAEIDKMEAEAVAEMDNGITPIEVVYAFLKSKGRFEDTTIDTFGDYKKSITVEPPPEKF